MGPELALNVNAAPSLCDTDTAFEAPNAIPPGATPASATTPATATMPTRAFLGHVVVALRCPRRGSDSEEADISTVDIA
jgi:hypothetical protein